MTYDEAVAYIHATQRFGSKPGLARVRALLHAMGNPQEGLRFVHIAGTNGKGSTAAMTASVLRKAGLKTGLFVSPFVEEFRERVQIDGEMLPCAEWAERVDAIRSTIDALVSAGGPQPTEFEIITALALLCFKEHACDIAVLEVGLGGRFDATNVIPPPDVAAITSLSLDHTEYLGDTLAQIAFEKCGILKAPCRAVTAAGQPEEALAVIRARAAEEGVPLTMPDAKELTVHSSGLEGSHFSYCGMELRVPLMGAHQIQNAMTVVEICRALGNIPETALREGLAEVRWGGRLEIVKQEPLVLLDGAHNPQKIAALCHAMDELFPGRRLIAVMGMSGDKDVAACVPPVARRAEVLLATQYEGARALPAGELAALATDCPRVETVPAVADACRRALEAAGPEDIVLVCGSLYLLGDAKRAFVG